MNWLHTQVDKERLLKSSKASLKVIPSVELQAAPLQPEGTLALQFSLHTYSQPLETLTLGCTTLYTQATPTTMDLLEELMLQLPEEMGLMSVAARQSQGRGFGGKAGLSPLGCAMFSVQVSVSSRLGQRIPFLQHLAALAAVEVDINRRLKWPNDIYYSNLMKLGRVLVTSTVMGPTFHLLVGCGFNGSNSNPTICINNLVMQHNRECGTSMEALSSAQLIGRTLTSLKQLISAFQERGQRPSCPSTTRDGCTGKQAVHSEEQGLVSLQANGNSFDMLRNLVVIKQR
uniref:BPL/LPL catalytic domain-containing protein n=1 Tax=Oncorhynchus tshawytscha TaxID=74940 RepID=A0A8C8HPA4_ONCTS